MDNAVYDYEWGHSNRMLNSEVRGDTPPTTSPSHSLCCPRAGTVARTYPDLVDLVLSPVGTHIPQTHTFSAAHLKASCWEIARSCRRTF
jgi:hypothetical protein